MNMIDKLIMFATGMVQVALVSMNVVFISKDHVVAMLATGYMISLVWTFNVKRVAFGGWHDRVLYAFGAMVGTGVGYGITKMLL